MKPDLFSHALEIQAAEIEKLRAENMELKIAAANMLAYIRRHNVATGIEGLGVRRGLANVLRAA